MALYLFRGGIGCLAQDERKFFRIREERLDAVLPKVGAESHRVCMKLFVCGAGVGLRGGADVSALRIQHNRDVRWNSSDGFLQRTQAGGSVLFVEGHVGLISAHQVAGLFDNRFAPICQARVDIPGPGQEFLLRV